jgi:RNA polymerase-binding protein DksA
MKKIESGKAKTPASKPLAKTVAKASPAKKAVKTVAKKAAPAKKAPVKAAAKAAPVKKAPVKAAAKAAPAKKAPVKAAAKAAPAKKAPVKAAAKAAPAKKVPVKAAAKAAPAKKAPVKAAAKAAPAKKAPVKSTVRSSAAIGGSSKKKADKNKDIQASHHGRIVTKAEVAAFQNQAEANGHIIRKSHFSPKQKKHYRDLLLDLRANYQDQLNIHRADALTNRKSGPGAGMATHMADLGSDNFQNDFELGLLSDEGTVIEMIDEALTRLDENEYGICIECGKEISPARLEIKPYARFCVACKSRKEANEGMFRR